jgi:tripartite-type tricarboxylate transporter receptor subunit TctC
MVTIEGDGMLLNFFVFKLHVTRISSPVIVTLISSLALTAPAAAQPYPARPVRIVVPFAPGGAVDLVARTVAQRLTDGMGQTFVVDNRGGAGGTIGTDIVAKARPDGYTVLVGSMGVAVNAVLYPRLPYDTVKDLAPVTMLGEQPNILVVHPSVAAKTVGDLLALARAKPGQITYGSGGVGSNSHLATVLFVQKAKIDLLHVPYKGLGPAITELVGGQVQLVIANVSTALPHVKAGRLRLLAVTTAKRFPLFPDTPTVGEGGVPGAESSGWYGLWGTAGTPQNVLNALGGETVKILKSPALHEQFAAQGLEPVPMTSVEFGKRVGEEIRKWGPVVKASGAKPE